jgi:hypothetical protein
VAISELHLICGASTMQYLLWEMGCFSMSKSSANSQLIQSNLFMRMRTDILYTLSESMRLGSDQVFCLPLWRKVSHEFSPATDICAHDEYTKTTNMPIFGRKMPEMILEKYEKPNKLINQE